MGSAAGSKRETAKSDTTEAARIAIYIRSALVSAGVDSRKADAWSLFCQDLFCYIQNDPVLHTALTVFLKGKSGKDVYDGSKMIAQSTKLIGNAASMGLVSATPRLATLRAGGAANVLSGFVDLFEGYAKGHGIELNECSLNVSKVILDLGGAMVGGATAPTGFGLILAAMSVLSMGQDSYSLGKACLNT